MPDDNDDMMKESCARCRWVRPCPQPHGATDYFCVRRQEFIRLSEIDQGLCLDFKP